MAAPEPPTVHADDASAAPNRLWRALGVVAALVMVLFWIWIFTGGPKKANADRLDDRAYVARSEQRCDRLLEDLEALPPASKSPDAAARAQVLRQANALVSDMVDDLEADAPRSGDDEVRLAGWFRDWRRYLRDRDQFAERLATDPSAQLTITENTELSDGVDKTIEIFADVNDMPSCATPGDVG